MRFSERLYNAPPTVPGQQAWASIWNRNGRTSSAAATIRVSVRNELEGRYVIITHALCIGVPGAGQNITQRQIELMGPDATVPSPPWLLAFNGTALGANVSGEVVFASEFILLPNWLISAQVAFNAGAVANAVTVGFYGYSIPIGTLQAF